MNEVTQGIVLKQSSYRENDLLVSVLTKEYGRLTFVAKGAKKLTSKNAVACTPFVVAEYIFDFQDEKTMYTLKNGVLQESNRHIRDNLEKVHAAQLFCELVELMIPQGLEEAEVCGMTYDLLLFCFQKLNEANGYWLPLCFFLAKTLEIQGVSPMVDGCVFCEDTSIDGIDLDAGGFICKSCFSESENGVAYSGEILKKFRVINKAKMEHYDILQNQFLWDYKDVEILIGFLQEHTGIYSKNWDFLKELIK